MPADHDVYGRMMLTPAQRVGAVTVGFLAITITAGAQSPTPPAGPDPTGIWTLQDENASISTSSITDRYYVNGLRLGYASPETGVPAPAASLSEFLWPGGAVRLSFDLTQQIYTPADTQTSQSLPGDRPYAGVLLGTLGLTRDVPDSRSLLAVSLGVVGPAALGEEIQNGFHDLIGQGHDQGWDSQLRNEPLLQITAGRTWRFPVAQFGGLETDALPDAAVGVGNLRIYAQSGVVLRLGQGLQSDYGAARILPGPSGGDAFRPTRPFAWYVFAGADGQAVAHDITLDGNDFQNSAHVTVTPLVGEFEGGLALMAYGARLTYTQVFQTQEFAHQHGGLHQVGSLALSVRF
jgi:hypothetical protein